MTTVSNRAPSFVTCLLLTGLDSDLFWDQSASAPGTATGRAGEMTSQWLHAFRNSTSISCVKFPKHSRYFWLRYELHTAQGLGSVISRTQSRSERYRFWHRYVVSVQRLGSLRIISRWLDSTVINFFSYKVKLVIPTWKESGLLDMIQSCFIH